MKEIWNGGARLRLGAGIVLVCNDGYDLAIPRLKDKAGRDIYEDGQRVEVIVRLRKGEQSDSSKQEGEDGS